MVQPLNLEHEVAEAAEKEEKDIAPQMSQITADVFALDSPAICPYLRPSAANPLCVLCFLLFCGLVAANGA
jgi:hypothetical protein